MSCICEIFGWILSNNNKKMTFSKERDQKQRKERTKEGRKVKKRKGKKRGKWRKGSMGMVEWKKGTFCLPIN